MSFFHAEGTIFIIRVIFVAFNAKDVLAFNAILLVLHFIVAHSTFEAVLASVLILIVSLVRKSFEFSTNGMVNIFAGKTLYEVVFDCHLTFNTRSAF
jgi:hypothetical protein